MTANNYDYSEEFRNAIRTAIQPWVEWKHISMGKTHCPTCLRLDKCWFVKDKMPMLPQHEYCHCTAVPKSTRTVYAQAKTTSPIKNLQSTFLIRITLKTVVKRSCLNYGDMIKRIVNGWQKKVGDKRERNILRGTIY